jgi:Mg2+ and Co2+ transporter CorA
MHSATATDALPSSGIVWAYRFMPDGHAEAIPNDRVDEALRQHGHGWIWIHLGLADTRCHTWITEHAPLSELAREVLAGPDRHMRLDILGDEIVGVLPDLHQELGGDTDDVVRVRFVMTDRMMLTARRGRFIRSSSIGVRSNPASASRPRYRSSTRSSISSPTPLRRWRNGPAMSSTLWKIW